MKFYKCDWCNKEIEHPIRQNKFYNPQLIDLCEKCNKKYNTMEKELSKYDKELREEYINKMLKKKEELMKNIKEEN